MFYISRLTVPFSFYMLYRRGTFGESFTFGEMRHLIRITLTMQFIDVLGHAMFRGYTESTLNKYVGDAAGANFTSDKAVMDDYLIQKNYFKGKKDGKNS